MEGIGGKARLRITTADGKPVHEAALDAPDHATALDAVAAVPDGPLVRSGLVAFGHRVVHGGPDMTAPVVVDAATLARIEALNPLAPLHNPPAVAVLRALGERFPGRDAGGVLRHRVSSRPSRGGRSFRHPRRAVSGRRAALRFSRPVVRIHRRRAGRSKRRRSRWGAWWWRIWGRARRCARWPAGAASIPRWGSPRWTGCRWARGPARWMPA